MIVDDEKAIRKGLCQCIDWSSINCNIFGVASDGIEALEQITPDNYPDVVITDIRMPGMDGLELCKELAFRYPQIKVILLTVYQEFEYVRQALDLHVSDYLLKPVSPQKIIETIQKIQYQISKEKTSQEEYSRLKSFSMQTTRLQQKIFLHELFDSDDISQDQISKKISKLGFTFNRFCLVAINSIIEDKGESPPLEIIDKLKSFADASFNDLNPIKLVHGIKMTLYLIIPADNASSNFFDIILNRCSELSQMVYNLSDFSVTVAISNIHEHLSEITQAKKEVVAAFQYSQHLSMANIIRYSQLEQLKPSGLEDINDSLSELRNKLDDHDYDATIKLINIIFRTAVVNKYPLNTIHEIAFFISSLCVSKYWDHGFFDKYIELQKDHHLHEILFSNSPEKIEKIIIQMIKNIFSDINNQSTNKLKIIQEIEIYIKSHLSEDLSLEKLASKVHVSSGHLSRIYKKETGYNLSYFIQTMRLEKAKALLKKTNMKTYEIAEKVGISDPVYFSKIFKNHTGLTPKEYRNNA